MRPRAADLMIVEYFEAEPASMPTQAFAQHHILINVRPGQMRLENWRNGRHRDFIFNENDIAVTPAGLQSGWRWHVKSQCIVITIDPIRLDRFTQSELGILLQEGQLCDLPGSEDIDITQAARQLVDAMRSRGPGFEVMYESLARVFLIKLIQKYGKQRVEALEYSEKFTAAHYKRVLDFVADNFGAAITVEQMAREAGLSASHFSRLFKQVIGDTPYQFLMRYRVEQAVELVAQKKRSLGDIALTCGFVDQPHFSRLFKAYMGETPKAFRERQKQESSNF